MPWVHSIDETANVALCRLRHLSGFADEVAAASSYLEDRRLGPGARILIDRTEAPIQASLVRLFDYANHIGRLIGRLERPRVAVVVGKVRDYGISRLFQMRSERQLEHEFAVFKTVAEAARWLDLDPDALVWPEFTE